MSTLPTPRIAPGPLVAMAVDALRAFGDLDRTKAAKILPMWRHVHLLDSTARTVVLAAFPPAPVPVVPPHVTGYPIGGRR